MRSGLPSFPSQTPHYVNTLPPWLRRVMPNCREPCRKALTSLKEHWQGLTLFVDDPRIPLDNNSSERLIRNPMGRKNYYGSGSEWAGRLAMMMFSILATLRLWKLNPRKWLSWYFEACAANGGRAPAEIESFLPWNLSEARIEELRSLGKSATPIVLLSKIG